MNNSTECDLSYDLVKLDYIALKNTAAIALRGCRNELDRASSDLQDGLDKDNTTRIHLSGERVRMAANSLAIATDVYAALLGGLTRSEVRIINKPEVENS